MLKLGLAPSHNYSQNMVSSKPPSIGSSGSANSISSMNSTCSITLRSRRRGRKRFSNNTPSAYGSNNAKKVKGDFYCTFCWKNFTSRHEWTRHETSVHMPVRSWVCCSSDATEYKQCPFCCRSEPDVTHLVNHRFFSCHEKPQDDRTFSRKDHFIQHVKNTHIVMSSEHSRDKEGHKNATISDRLQLLAQEWYQRPPELGPGSPALYCGFCATHLECQWTDRVEHMTNHFKSDGFTQDRWKPNPLLTTMVPTLGSTPTHAEDRPHEPVVQQTKVEGPAGFFDAARIQLELHSRSALEEVRYDHAPTSFDVLQLVQEVRSKVLTRAGNKQRKNIQRRQMSAWLN